MTTKLAPIHSFHRERLPSVAAAGPRARHAGIDSRPVVSLGSISRLVEDHLQRGRSHTVKYPIYQTCHCILKGSLAAWGARVHIIESLHADTVETAASGRLDLSCLGRFQICAAIWKKFHPVSRWTNTRKSGELSCYLQIYEARNLKIMMIPA